MLWNSIARLIIFMSLLFMIPGCTIHEAYRTEAVTPPAFEPEDPDKADIEVGPEEYRYILGFVEFDDQGAFWNRTQVMGKLNDTRGEGLLDRLERLAEDEAKYKGILMLVFVHGWHHNARHDDDNVRTFREVLRNLQELENESDDDRRRKVVGVYVGWRGESLRIPLLNALTFWERKNTAENCPTIMIS